MTRDERVGVALITVDYRDSIHPDLPVLRKGVEKLAGLWDRHAAVERGLRDPDLPSSDRQKLLEAVHGWCRGLPHDHILLLYWGGHAKVEGACH